MSTSPAASRPRWASRPSQYILQLRIERACDLLLSENWSVKEVAYSAGFQSEHYFCRVFHKLKGVTASQFRELNMEPSVRNLYSAVQQPRRQSYRPNTYSSLDAPRPPNGLSRRRKTLLRDSLGRLPRPKP